MLTVHDVASLRQEAQVWKTGNRNGWCLENKGDGKCGDDKRQGKKQISI